MKNSIFKKANKNLRPRIDVKKEPIIEDQKIAIPLNPSDPEPETTSETPRSTLNSRGSGNKVFKVPIGSGVLSNLHPKIDVKDVSAIENQKVTISLDTIDPEPSTTASSLSTENSKGLESELFELATDTSFESPDDKSSDSETSILSMEEKGGLENDLFSLTKNSEVLMGSRPKLEEKDKSINDYNDEYTGEFNEEVEFIDEKTNPEIPLNSEGDSKNLEDELFELARLKLWSSGVPPSSTIEKNDKTVEDNQRALEPLTLFEPSTSEKGSELKRDKIEKWAITFQRAWN